MENSMLTGMRAMDMKGCITYVNSAFCQMTGWDESELVGIYPPYPHWPDSDHELLAAKLEEELSGRTSQSGLQVKVKRKDGSIFDARLYVSPLIDASGEQSGWMTSMTDITEPNRIRQQLSASYERFTTVLEALDASVSVTPIGSTEILFTNKLYRQWFGSQSEGHLQMIDLAFESMQTLNTAPEDADDMVGLPTGSFERALSENAEIFIAGLDKWLEVRSRYLNWVDGRLAQMIIATDITPRRQAEEQSAMQAERAQSVSRLITMGEMASSVAHELNQPLTAISNYCTGMVSRIKNQQIVESELLTALEKTAHQAQRAGQIIQRIRSFVKRSEPNRSLANISTIVMEAVELADIELKRRQVKLTHYISTHLPPVMLDPILIEQVLVNLLKNAAESIDNAKRELHDRHVELKVVPKVIDGQKTIEFTVTDSGQGLSNEVLERLFEAFFSTKTEGMGIGLNLCRSIVESHHGRMHATNLYNQDEVKGCCFSFWLPCFVQEVAH
jgi:PAS domain S-box-containing protein